MYFINDSKYFKVVELMKYHLSKKFFSGCKQSPRRCLSKHNIDYTDYMCAVEKDGNWKTGYDPSFRKANLFLKATYVNDNVFNEQSVKEEPEIINVFSKYVCEFPCIYLFSLGVLSELDFVNTSKKYEEEECFVYKFGMTNNIQRRTCEHLKTYNVYENVSLHIEMFAYIQNDKLYAAESKLRNYFKMSDMIVSHTQYKELLIIPKSKLPLVKHMYNDIYNLFNKKKTS